MTAARIAQAVLDDLTAAGYVVLCEKSYRQAQERQRVAECRREAEERAAESARAWARDCLTEERRLRERITHVYSVARAHGATFVELAGARVQVSWVDHDPDDGDIHETGWIIRVDGDQAVINCDCGPRTVQRPLAELTLQPGPVAS